MHFATIRHYRTRDFYVALQFAMEQHGVQQYDDFPFVFHPLAVADFAFASGLTDPVGQVALILHDTLEDTPLDAEGLREFVEKKLSFEQKDKERLIQMVKDLTDDVRLEKHERKAAQLVKLPQLPYKTQMGKLADRAVNVGAMGLSKREVSRFYWTHSVEAYGIFKTTLAEVAQATMDVPDEYYLAGVKMLRILRDLLVDIDEKLKIKEAKRKEKEPTFVVLEGTDEMRERLELVV